MRVVAAALVGVMVLGGCGFLKPSGSAAARWANLEKARAAKAAGTDANYICKSMPVMGSLFPQRVCSTAEEWDQFDEQQRAAADEIDRQRRAASIDREFEGGN